MQFGAFLPTYWTDYGQSKVRTAIEETAKSAETLGYASLWANDHLIAPAARASFGHIIEPLLTLASLIHLTEKIHFGTSTLVLPQRNAIVVAKQVAALDVLSGGRFILGLGVGWFAEEFKLLNANFEARGAVTDEAVEVMRALWREPRATFHGQYYDLTEAVAYPKPVNGNLPIWVCGNTPPAIRRAARYGDAWNPFGIKLDAFKAGLASLRAKVQDRPMPLVAAHMQIRIMENHGPARGHINGSVEQVADLIVQYHEAGLEYLICDFVADDLADLLRQMQVMAEQIVPQFGH